MSGGSTSRDQLYRADGALAEALKRWNAADLNAVEGCNRILESSAAYLRDLQNAVALGTVVVGERERDVVLSAQRKIQVLASMVDAAIGFVRGAMVSAGGGALTYTAEGAIQHDPAGQLLCEAASRCPTY